ncbi:unnamed protein product [Rhizophagus irregularis]|nr:unnamed protein product [Rhizophagus irregularis]
MALVKFCPNLKNLCTPFKNDESETLKLILNNCQYLEIIKVHEWFNDCHYSKIVHKLHEELEEFFVNWQDRISQRSLY